MSRRFCFPPGAFDLHAAQQREHLQAVDPVPLRQRLFVSSGEHGGSQLQAERHAQIRRPVLPGQQFRGGRGIRPGRRRTAKAGAVTAIPAAAVAPATDPATAVAAVARAVVHPATGRLPAATAATATATAAPAVRRQATVAQPGVPLVRGDQHSAPAEETGPVAAAAAATATAATEA